MLGWSARGLRCPDYQISFEKKNGQVYPVSLIQMPNGTGKTTTLTLLRAALSGSAEQWDYQTVLSFQKRLNPRNNGEFQVSLKYNGSRITIRMVFDFDEGKVRYFTTTNSYGNKSGFKPPVECKEFLNPEFINFFVFDGELAQQLLDPNYSNAEKAIEYLYQLKYFRQMESEIKAYWKRKVESTKATGKKGYTQRKLRVTSLELRLEHLRREKEILEKELNENKHQLDALKNKYQEKILNIEEKKGEYEERKSAVEHANQVVNDLTQQLLRASRSPHNLSEKIGKTILDLKKNMDRVKLPESTAKEFFLELAEEENCVCGRPLDSTHRDYIRERASNYLGSDEMTLLNSIKSEISAQIENVTRNPNELSVLLSQYDRAVDVRMRAQTQLEMLERELESGDSELSEARERMNELSKKIEDISDKLDRFNDKDDGLPDELTYGISVLENRLKEAKDKLAEITETITIKEKTELLSNIIQYAFELSQQQISEYIKNEANKRIKLLMPNNNIKISKIDRALKLEGQEAGSVGETLSVAYAFMATLFNGVDRQLPFIVDSPANSIDNKVRTQVAELIPKLSKQFIAFTISSERGSFIAPLERSCNGDVQFITMFRKGDPALEHLANQYSNVVYTEDGVLVSDREFFWNFHKESEADE